MVFLRSMNTSYIHMLHAMLLLSVSILLYIYTNDVLALSRSVQKYIVPEINEHMFDQHEIETTATKLKL